jgi:type II restriction/modification system DNA methylase subunit YeeA
MDTSKLKKFAQFARRQLREQVTAKLKLVLAQDSPARRESPEAVQKLEGQIKACSKDQVIEQVAYTWFNRFCALRFMDVNRYNRIGVVSPAEGQFQPEILAEAKMGYVDEEMVPEQTRKQIFALLDGSAPSPEPQAEAYPLLVVAVCNDYHRIMPYLFERIDDYTELLMPDDLLSGNSILAYTREAMTPEACEDVEVIGWLYQFYISEKKDEVFAALKKNKKITPENIPAATQLFTPHWIVRYLVENSLGRLWMLNRPQSKLIDQMDYFIKPEQVETDFLKVSSPEELKICDPACGSGHMLTYAFDLLYAIYEEEGYEPTEIPEKILTQNLYGIEIDRRAGELAAFALTMKAREKQRRFFRKPVQPNICVLQAIRFEDGELKDYMDFIGRDLFTAPLLETLHQFREADNFGSLIRPTVTDVGDVLALLEEKDVAGQLLLYKTHEKALQVLQQADYLSPKYHVVIANPPYMGGRGMNEKMSVWAKETYPNSKADLFAMFIERNLDLAQKQGLVAMVTMQSWMFLSSYEKLRARILNNATILSMSHLGARAFDSIGGEVVSTTAFVIENSRLTDLKGAYLRLTEGNSESEKDKELKAKRSNPFLASASDFKQIPGCPIAYWASDALIKAFTLYPRLSSIGKPRQGLATTDNDRFLRFWYEIKQSNSYFKARSAVEALSTGARWFPCQKGGGYKKWYGNNEYVVNWENDGEAIKLIVIKRYGNASKRVANESFYFQSGITWSTLSSSSLAMRFVPRGHIFETKGAMCFFDEDHLLKIALGFCNSNIVNLLLECISPTLDFHEGPIGNIPIPVIKSEIIENNVDRCIEISKSDWSSYETSWDFTILALLHTDYRQLTLKKAYVNLRDCWQSITDEIQQLEEENNLKFIEAYNLQYERSPDVPLNEITLTFNPHYRYGGNKTEAELEALLLADTMKEFISYAVGCMFGRYSLDKPGLILANQGETIDDYRKLVPNSTFPADEDNVIPMLDGDWFPDDIAERFRKFLRVTFGEEHYEENLKFLENAIGKDIRKYFLRDFYNDHVRRYKKRPIYWLFSSPKGTFNALIYMHRYRPDTVSVVLNDYLREFRTKLTAHKHHLEQVSISESASASEKTKALREIENLNKMIEELEDYERDVLYPLATEQVEIDLDDGVKVNYGKFGAALKKVTGLS